MNTQDIHVATTLKVLVREKETVADGIVRFELRPTSGELLPSFTAGSHIDVTLPNGAVRQYSLCNAPDDNGRYEIAVLLEPLGRGGSRSAHVDLHRGSVLQISPPRNLFPLSDAGHSILIAGGIGITPILSMAHHLACGGRSFELHYCTRSVARTAFLERITSSEFADSVTIYHDDYTQQERFSARNTLASPTDDTHIYVCGPTGFMDHVIGVALAAGWQTANVHREYFVAPSADTSGDRPFTVEFARTGQAVVVPPSQSVAQALAAHGIDIPVSCEQGICGTCMMRVLEGEPDHRDTFLTTQEHAANDRFTPCCSRSKTARLVIDF
ncbi:vanillate O-demethylase oxidoreductase VanB (plasmid) [Cupriavidus necator N-1]|uniref:Vanillate O-demethylase oxidoreductase VanB n=1 Tax=Cupriavidus necator (strain ATCC 43291 / DSM 13513 / CCUG 52238 / LMG 8453 / N-1) TaxID=1042878 RepID=F8GVD0_CUPNN|nr:PDR/VanB family oxidoreductase [Cupriavidus necator]AEI82630.1 vanillate O-demethylase oxidoreductase VanB [Cupriavidus necator N-1]MDX6007627.1 PDR/VanB family oxidoreductase [Cupriavidus necator]